MSNKSVNAALDSGNYSLALKLATEDARKKPTSLNQASKINTLAHVNPKSAYDELSLLIKQTPSDPSTLKLIIETLKLLDVETSVDVFENAARKYGSGLLILEWNQYTINESDYLGFQKSSALLKKLMGTKIDENTQAVRFRAVAATVIACKSVGSHRLDSTKKKLLCMLALKLIEESGLADEDLDSHQMYLKAQLLIVKNDLELASSSLKVFLAKERDLELLLMYFDILNTLRQWDELRLQCIAYLKDADDWDTWKLAIKASRESGHIDEMISFLHDYKTTRNSALARIEIADSQTLKMKEVDNYLTLYMHKPCCFQDLKNFANQIEQKDLFGLIEEQFSKRYSTNNNNDLIVIVNYVKFKAFLNKSVMETPEFINECWNYYNETCHLLSSLPEYDFHAGYELIILIVQSMILQNNFDCGLILKLIVIFEWALKHNKFEFHLKLWLIKLYQLINQPALAIKHHNDLKIKNLQYDTIGVQSLTKIVSTAASIIGFSSLQVKESSLIFDLLKSCSEFYSKNVERELSPSIMQCIDFYRWQKLGSYMNFQNRLRHSLSKYYMTLLELQKCRLRNEDLVGLNLYNKLDTLKDFYKRSQAKNTSENENVDTDVKVNDNLDRTTLWDCGTHEKIDKIDKSLLNISIDQIKIKTIVTLLVYEPQSRIWDQLLDDLRHCDLSELPSVEQWCISGFIALLSGESKVAKLPKEPENPISWEFNNYYGSLLDFTKMLDLVIKSPHTKDNLKSIRKERNKIAEICRGALVRSSDIKQKVKAEYKNQFTQIEIWLNETQNVKITKSDVVETFLSLGIDL